MFILILSSSWELYWSLLWTNRIVSLHPGTKRLECMNPNQLGRRKIVEGIQYPFGVTSYGKNLYYTDWRRYVICKRNYGMLYSVPLSGRKWSLYCISHVWNVTHSSSSSSFFFLISGNSCCRTEWFCKADLLMLPLNWVFFLSFMNINYKIL